MSPQNISVTVDTCHLRFFSLWAPDQMTEWQSYYAVHGTNKSFVGDNMSYARLKSYIGSMCYVYDIKSELLCPT